MRSLPWLLALGCARPAFEIREVPDLVLARVVATHLDEAQPLTVRCVGGGDDLTRAAPASADHELLVAGLQADTTYACTASLGRSVTAFEFHTDEAPASIPSVSVTTTGDGSPGYVLVNHSLGRSNGNDPKILIYDTEGALRWYHHVAGSPTDLDAQLVDDRVVYGGGYDTRPRVIELDGAEVVEAKASSSGSAHHHHAELLRSGELVGMAGAKNEAGGVGWDGFVVDLYDGGDGAVTWTWNSQAAVDQGALPVAEVAGDDAYHANWVQVTATSLFVNLRQLHRVLKVDRASGQVVWSLGVGGDFALVDPDGAPLPDDEWFYGAHGLDLIDDTLIVYDNGWSRPGADTSRAVVYTLDEDARVATRTWSWSGEGWYEPIWGDADLLGDDRVWVTQAHCGDCDISGGPSAIVEVERATGEAVWTLTFPRAEDSVYRSAYVDGCALFGNTRFCLP
jgi:hypothetical protein